MRLEILKVPVAAIEPDPALPPRIVDPGRFDALKGMMSAGGLPQPLLVRPVPHGPQTHVQYFAILGLLELLAAKELGWSHVHVLVRHDLVGATAALLVAHDAHSAAVGLKPLEHAWYYAGLKDEGMTYAAIAARQGFSVGKAHMYVLVGTTLTPERILSSGMDLATVAKQRITRLSEIAKQDDQDIDDALRAACDPTLAEDKPAKPTFAWQRDKNGGWRANAISADPEEWSAEGRQEFMSVFGPLLASARAIEGVEDPAVVAARDELVRQHRHVVLDLRERHAESLIQITEKIVRAGTDPKWPAVNDALTREQSLETGRVRGWWWRPLARAWRSWVERTPWRSTFEARRSIIERDPAQLAIPFEGSAEGQAA